ncbi:hypothetical protein GCM10020255_081470 [Rhodococcus baikonurensis]
MTNAVQMSSSENIEDPTVNTPAAEEAVATEPGITFAEIGLPEQLVAALARNSITVPSPIQAQSIPDALAGIAFSAAHRPDRARLSPSACRC